MQRTVRRLHLRMNGLIFGDSSLRREGPRTRPHGQTFPRMAPVHGYAAKSRTIRPEMHGYFGARGALVRFRQTNRAADRRYDFANYRDF